MAAYGDLASLLNNIEQLMAHPRLSTSVDKNQIQTLHGKADELLNFITNNNYGVGTKEADDLERQIASTAQVAEDVIESHIVDQIHAESDRATRGFFFNLRQIIKPSLGCALDVQQIIEDMDSVMKKATEVGEKWRLREKQPTDHAMEALEEKAAENQRLTTIGDMSPVGLEDDVLELVDKLCLDQPKRHLISIVGMGGSGKTTLARNVYDNLLIKERFHVRAWATVSQQYSVLEILSQLLSCLGKKTGNDCLDEKTENDLGVELYQTLFGRKFLVVLDDIWSVEPWNNMRQFFPDTGNGSRVVLTTRLLGIARNCLSYFCFTMNLLDEERSWKLLCQKAFKQESCPYPELEKVGKEIASLCRGLPLSIVVIGGLLLNSPRSIGFWKRIARNIKSLPNAKEKQESLAVLSLSYKHLPPHLKPCFLYMGGLKEDSVIRVSKIIRLWVAEGFVRPSRTQVLEEIAEDYLKDLISRNLVLVEKFSCDGRIGSFRIHDLLRDLCFNLAEQQDFFRTKNSENREMGRRLVFEGRRLRLEIQATCDFFNARSRGNPGMLRRLLDKDGSLDIQGTLDFFRATNRGNHQAMEPRLVFEDRRLGVQPPLARSIVATYNHEHPPRYKLMRVLVESRSPSTKAVFENVNLRYLDYKHTHRQADLEFPTSLSVVWNLQTLIISRFRSEQVVVAPIEIWKMRQLRHVMCPRIYVPDPPRSKGQDCMENLQTFTTAINFRSSEEVSKIIPNIKKVHLIYDPKLKGYNGRLIECLCYLGRFNRLESVKMELKDCRWPTRNSDMLLAFPTSLKKLSLRYCKLHWDDLAMIGSLPHLQVLNLGRNSVDDGGNWSLVPGKFLQLKFLKIEHCDLRCWDADDSHFPVLEKLVLVDLTFLEEIPLGIGDIPTLGLIRVELCNELSLAISAMRIKEDQFENQGIDALQIQVKVLKTQEDSFREKVETEGLKINDIQLQIV